MIPICRSLDCDHVDVLRHIRIPVNFHLGIDYRRPRPQQAFEPVNYLRPTRSFDQSLVLMSTLKGLHIPTSTNINVENLYSRRLWGLITSTWSLDLDRFSYHTVHLSHGLLVEPPYYEHMAAHELCPDWSVLIISTDDPRTQSDHSTSNAYDINIM